MSEGTFFLLWVVFAAGVKLAQLALVPGYGRAHLDWATFQGPPIVLRHPVAGLVWLVLVATPPLILFAIGWRP